MKNIIIIIEESVGSIWGVLGCIALVFFSALFALDVLVTIWYWILLEAVLCALISCLIGKILGRYFFYPDEFASILAILVMVGMTILNYRLYFQVADDPCGRVFAGVGSFLLAAALGILSELLCNEVAGW